MTRYPSRQWTSGRPAAKEVRMVTSSPASAQYRQTIAAEISEPPASGSSRSRQARMLTRRSPASAARSPILAMVASWSVIVGSPGAGPAQPREPSPRAAGAAYAKDQRSRWARGRGAVAVVLVGSGSRLQNDKFDD